MNVDLAMSRLVLPSLRCWLRWPTLVAVAACGSGAPAVDANSGIVDAAPADADASRTSVLEVTSATPDGIYGLGEVISIQVVFSDEVTVLGAPILALNSGVDATATYESGTGTATLNLSYTVEAGQASPDLDYASGDSLSAGGSIQDAAGNDVTLTLPMPGAPGSLGANKAIIVDPGPPTVPLLRKPSNNSYEGSIFVSGSRRPTFVWEASSGGVGTIGYDLEISTDATFSTDVTLISTTATSYQPPSDLPVALTAPVGARYYWRVRACAGDCSAHSSQWWVNVGRSNRDFNGDGFADLIVGAPTGLSAGGRALVYFGGSTLDATADGVLTGGSQFGRSVASAGDVNGDGFADAIVGAPGYFSDGITGTAHIYLGAAGPTFDTTADGTLTGTAIRDQFGYSVGPAGDVNGDGFDDVVVGAPNNSAGGMYAGQAKVYLGSAGMAFDATADGTLTGSTASGGSGWSVSSAGDVNGDGFADVVVGAPYSGPGNVAVYLGGAGSTFDATAEVTLVGSGNDSFGESVASAGDVNGDGFADVIVGAHNDSGAGSQAGAAKIYLGAAGTTLDATADATLTGPGTGYEFGISVASAGDVNGDGFGDVVVGARHLSGDYIGHAYVFFGASGMTFDGTADGALDGSESDDVFGFSVASTGDANGDGFDDVIVGAPDNSAGGTNAGLATFYVGAAGTTFDVGADGTLTGIPGDVFGLSVGR